MDMYQRFKKFLGLPSTDPNPNNSEQYNRPPVPPFGRGDEGGVEPPRIIPDHYDSFGFNIFSSPIEMHKYFEHQMNEMLKNFGIFSNDGSFFGNFGGTSEPFFGENPFGHNDLETYQFPAVDDFSKENQLRSGNLRDQYLKPGYEETPRGQRKVDSDVDERFNMKELDTVLKHNPVQVQPKRFFYGQSMTSKTIRNADGTIESHRTIKDHDGNEETTITKRHGDKEYSVTTKRNKDGVQEEIENMVNLDEKEKDHFMKRYQKLTDQDVKSPPNDFPYNFF